MRERRLHAYHDGELRPGAAARAARRLERSPEDRAELARLAFERGDYPTAEKHVDRAIALDDGQLLARWLRGELHRVAGRLEKAELAYRWLVRYYNANDVEDAESLRWIGLAAARYARWKRLDDQFGFLVNELYPDALKLDEAYWPARYESGLLFLEKYNRGDAAEDLKAALELNPQAAEVHAAMARLAAHLIESGGADRVLAGHHLEALERRKICLDLLGRWDPRCPPGALIAWLALPDPWRSADFAAEAERRELEFPRSTNTWPPLASALPK